MELFVNADQPNDKLSMAIEMLAVYTRATHRGIVRLNSISKDALSLLGLKDIPMLLKSVPVEGNQSEEQRCASPYAISLEISRACYLEDVLMGKKNSDDRTSVSHWYETVTRLSVADMMTLLNTHMATRMFLVGTNVSAADIFVFAHICEHFATLKSFEKMQVPHLFRWVDHVQHLPGMLEQVESRELLCSFPDEFEEGPSKAQLKKMAKLAAAAEKKATKKAGGNQSKEGAPEEKKQAAPQQQQPGQQQQKPKQKQQQKQQPAKKAPEPVVPDIQQMDIRVGKITKVWKHPDSEKLYCEEIDIGNGETRKIASGLQKFLPIEALENAMVVVLSNLKEKKLAGYPSHGMVLCGETPARDAVQLITPPEGALVGDLIHFPGEERNPPAQLHVKKDPWGKVQPDMVINAEGVAAWKDKAFTIEGKGVCKVASIKNGIIH